MAGHFPFAARLGVRYGLAPRMTLAAFFEQHGMDAARQEKYYRWWYEWTKNFVLNDADLNAAKGVYFKNYPYGSHAHENFHLKDKYWASCMSDLGDVIRDLIFPKLSAEAMHELEEKHHHLLEELAKEAEANPRQAAPDIGYFRHV